MKIGAYRRVIGSEEINELKHTVLGNVHNGNFKAGAYAFRCYVDVD